MSHNSNAKCAALQRSSEPYCDTVIGTAEALVREGVVARLDLLPGCPGCPTKTSASYGPDGQRRRGQRGRGPWNVPGAVDICRRGKHLYEVRIGIDQAERERRRVPGDVKERAEAQEAIDAMPRSADAFRAECARRMDSMLQSCRSILETSIGGYCAGEKALIAFDEAAAQLVAVAAEADVQFSRELRTARVAAIAQSYSVPPSVLVDKARAARPHLALVSSRPAL